MADVFTPEKRSQVMSRIRGRDTKPELALRSMLHRLSYRFTTNGPKNKQLPGKPDIVLPKYRTVIFVHGCFWHGHENCPAFPSAVIADSSSEAAAISIDNRSIRTNVHFHDVFLYGHRFFEITLAVDEFPKPCHLMVRNLPLRFEFRIENYISSITITYHRHIALAQSVDVDAKAIA
jgi:DNA mismatch endonuclease Vsr